MSGSDAPQMPSPLKRSVSDATPVISSISPLVASLKRSDSVQEGSPNVSKPHNVKRLLHVEWDAATGSFVVRVSTVMEMAQEAPVKMHPWCAVRGSKADIGGLRCFAQGLPDVWASALPASVARDVMPSQKLASHVAPAKPSKSLVTPALARGREVFMRMHRTAVLPVPCRLIFYYDQNAQRQRLQLPTSASVGRSTSSTTCTCMWMQRRHQASACV